MDAPDWSKDPAAQGGTARASEQEKHEWILQFSNDTARQVATIWHCGRMAEV